MRNTTEIVGMIVGLMALFAVLGAGTISAYSDCRANGMSGLTCFWMIRR